MSGMNEYVPAHLAIEAMRDNGYRNTAYAVAELIDNSIQAGATEVQLLCAEKEEIITTRLIRRMSAIAVIDNGAGMDSDVLKTALQFGNGTRLGRSSRTGIGRFGMGLPASSISQCRKVELWSWQNGVDNALYTYLDVDEVKNGQSTVPEPINKKIPRKWLQVAKEVGNSGTLVVWSKLDRLLWNKASTLIDNSELLIGRIYRKFLYDGTVKIRMAAFDTDNASNLSINKNALPNDPGYLMEKTSCPAPFDNQPMFDPFGENHEARFTIGFQGENHDVVVRLSIAKDEARADQAGNTYYGQHARKNVGISVVRAGRELELDQSTVIQYDPRERWWGIEIEFPPLLDELMGVTNNKQAARNLADILNTDFEIIAKAGKTIHQLMADLEAEGDPRAPLLQLVNFVKNQQKAMRTLIKEQGVNTRTTKTKRHDAEKTATIITEKRQEEGLTGTSDKEESKPTEEKIKEIKEELVEAGVDEETAEALTAQTISDNLKYLFIEAPLEGDAFFSVRPKGGVINIIINKRHPAYDNMVSVLEKDTEGEDAIELGDRLQKAFEGLKLILMAWARYEDEQPDGMQKDRVQNARSDWGRVAKSFLRGY